MHEDAIKLVVGVVILILIVIFNGIKGGIARIADARRRYVVLKMFNLNLIAFIPCFVLPPLIVAGISYLHCPTYNELETIGLKIDYVYVEANQEFMTILSRIDDGRQLYSSKGYRRIEIMNNGNLVVCPDRDDYTSAEYIKIDGTPVPLAMSFYYQFFSEAFNPYYRYVIWGAIVFSMIAVNVLGHSIYSHKVTLLALKNDILA